MNADLNNTWLIMYHDEDYHEPAGLHTGNLIEIMYKFYSKPQHWEIAGEYYYEAHCLDELITRGNQRVESDGVTNESKLSSVNFRGLSDESVQTLLQKETEEFTREFPNVSIIVYNNSIKFKTLNDKIQNELDALSDDAKEYIRKNGI